MLSLNNGVVWRERILFDPHKKARAGTVFVSHAHSDHAKQHATTMLCTPATASIAGLDAECIDIGQKTLVGDAEVSALNAGHVIGSAQFLVAHDGGSTAYTGDFKTEDCILLKGAEALQCDDLVIETTFGSKQHTFPAREDVYSEMTQWINANTSAGRVVVLGGYPVGKAQELTRLVSEAGHTPVVHPRIFNVNRKCADYARLGDYVSSDSAEARDLMKGPFVAIMPFNSLSPKLSQALKAQTGRNVVSAVATGWARTYSFKTMGVDRAFQLSDHADFPHLMDYVERSGAKRVHTVHGYAHEFARELRKRGVDAKPLSKLQAQRTITAF
ncbi:MAG: hypothetical protein JW834_04055 [Candidatus Diapherotrites archaeon]|nr:hypothetical protein [Candidatus Diapherotrites archaeon]